MKLRDIIHKNQKYLAQSHEAHEELKNKNLHCLREEGGNLSD